jgi:hypothetical protein
MAELLKEQQWSPSLVLDLLAGAMDARLNPKLFVPDKKGEEEMFSKAARLRCAGYGPNVTSRDQWWSIAVALGVTVGVTILWLRLRVAYPRSQFVTSFLIMSYSLSYMLTLPFTSLKGRSRRTQAFLIGGMLLFLTVIWLLVGLILASRH